MAEKLNAFPGGPPQEWDRWLDGSVWLLRQGLDYEIGTPSMRVAASRAAKARGVRVRTRVIRDEKGEALAIQALDST